MNKQQRVDNWKLAVFSDDWEAAISACSKLLNFGGRFNKTGRRRCQQFLLDVLSQEKPLARNAAALTFREYHFQPALLPLLRAIHKVENARYRGILLYALEMLDCSQPLSALFGILFGAVNNWEVQASALTILEEQIFEFTSDELYDIAAGWDAVKDDWNRLNDIDESSSSKPDHDRALIQDFVDGYLAYLK